MRSLKMTGAIVVSMAALLAAGSALADTLNLECRVQWSKPGGQHRDAKRRLEVNLGAKTVKTWDDVGRGYQFKSEHPFPSANGDRIVLEASGGKTSWLDRRTGQYYFKNDREGFVIRGPCVKTAPMKPAF
jgi:hypothetical protein